MKAFPRRTVTAVLFIVPLAAIAQPPQRWRAESTTAMSITGDMRFTPARITFANNAWLPLRFVANVPGLTWMPGRGPGVEAALYRITLPQNPTLLRGNRLCGAAAPTYLSVARQDGEIYLSLYDTPAAPTLMNNNFCAGYDYTPK